MWDSDEWDEEWEARCREEALWEQMCPAGEWVMPLRAVTPGVLRGWVADWRPPGVMRVRPAARVLAADLAYCVRRALERADPVCAMTLWLGGTGYPVGRPLPMAAEDAGRGAVIETPAERGTPRRVVGLVRRIVVAHRRRDAGPFSAVAAEAEVLGREAPVWRVVGV